MIAAPRLCALVLPALLALVSCADRMPGAPALTAVAPERALPDQELELEIRGRDFTPALGLDLEGGGPGPGTGFSARLGDLELEDVRYVDPTHLTARLPPGLPEGLYVLRVVDPRGAMAELPDAFEIAPDVYQGPGTAPWAKVQVTPTVALTGDPVTFDATTSVDFEDPAESLEARWDFEGDGTFDTAFTPTLTAVHAFADAGIYDAVVELRDPSGRTALAQTAAIVAAPQTLLVVTTGRDENDPGSTPSSPRGMGFSLREAVKAAAAAQGPSVIAFAGPMTVTLDMALNFPQLADPLTLVGQPGVVVDATQVSGVPGIQVRGVDSRILHLDFTGSPWVAVDLAAPTARIAYGRFYGNVAGVLATAAGSVVGPGNVVEDNQYVGIAVAGAARVEGNRIARSGDALYVVEQSGGAVLERNVVYDNSGAGVITRDDVFDVTLRHNTFHACGEAGVEVGANNSGLEVLNNIFTGGQAAAVSGPAAAFARLDFNAHSGNAGGPCAGGCAFGPGSTDAPPGYVDPDRWDLRLRADSPLVDLGTPLGVDLNGPAPGTHDGAAPDPGAQEASP